MRVKKSINNNVLCAVDEKGQELIVTGRGVGFQKKPGERVDESKIEKVYRMETKEDQRKLRELADSIPVEHLSLTAELVAEIRRQLRQPMNESLLITLADHISFAIQRKQKGIVFKNPLGPAIMSYYPEEYRLGLYCLDVISRRLSVRLSDDEASFIALHIVNAEMNTRMSQMNDIIQLLQGCVRVTEFYYRTEIDRGSLDFSRFIIHLRYMVKRLYEAGPDRAETSDGPDGAETSAGPDGLKTAGANGERSSAESDGREPSAAAGRQAAPAGPDRQRASSESGVPEDEVFRGLIRKNCADQYECARRIASYIQANYGLHVSEDEIIYLTIHLKRMNLEHHDIAPHSQNLS